MNYLLSIAVLVIFFCYKQWSFNRWIRKLDAEERIGVAKMRQEWHENETKWMMEEFFKPVVFKRPPKRRSKLKGVKRS